MSVRPESGHPLTAPSPQSARHLEERKTSRVPPPIVEAHLITQHGQGGQEVEEAPSYNENLISFEPVYREEDVASIEVVDLQRTPHRYHNAPQQRGSTRQVSDQVSIYSDSGSVWEDVRALQGELRRKRRELDEVRRRCVLAETEWQNGEWYVEKIKGKIQEEELEKVRGELRKRERELHGMSSENEAAEKQHLKTMLGHKEHENQLLAKEIAGLRSEKLKLKERVETMWADYQKYKTQHEGILKSLEKERQALVEKLSKRESDVSRSELIERDTKVALLEEANEELRGKLREKDERTEQLHRQIEALQRENKAILEATQSAEPPPEEVQPEETYSKSPIEEESHAVLPPSKPESRPRTEDLEPGPEVTTVSEPLVEEFEEISLEETHPTARAEETKEPVRHGEEAAGAEVHSKPIPTKQSPVANNPFAKSTAPELSLPAAASPKPASSNPFSAPPRAPETTLKSEESKDEPEFPRKLDSFDLLYTSEDPKSKSDRVSPHPKLPTKMNPFSADAGGEDDFFAEMQKKGAQEKKKKAKPYTSIPKTLFD